MDLRALTSEGDALVAFIREHSFLLAFHSVGLIQHIMVAFNARAGH
jgi:hypothetical protein